MGILLAKAPFMSVVTLNWPHLRAVLTSTTDTRTCSPRCRQSLAGDDELGADLAGEDERLGRRWRRSCQGEEPDQHQQELGERLAMHQGDALLQAWLAMV